jgi:hypothetical protein
MKKDNKDHFNTFLEKNKDKLKEKQICPVCGGKYVYLNKYHHNKTKKHLFSEKLINENYILNYNNEKFFNKNNNNDKNDNNDNFFN